MNSNKVCKNQIRGHSIMTSTGGRSIKRGGAENQNDAFYEMFCLFDFHIERLISDECIDV